MASPHSDEIKAAVLAAVASGRSVNSIAREFNIGRVTITRWQNQAGMIQESSGVVQQKKHDIGMQVYGLLEDSINNLRVQLRATSDEAWIKRQSANDLAIYFGVLADKSIRLLSAFRPTDDTGAGDE